MTHSFKEDHMVIKKTVGGYAELDSTGKVPIEELASGSPSGTKFIRDDRTLQEISVTGGQIGPPGVDGMDGEDGIQGPIGLKGDKGDTGDAGSPGAIGVQGLQGLMGFDGDEGEEG